MRPNLFVQGNQANQDMLDFVNTHRMSPGDGKGFAALGVVQGLHGVKNSRSGVFIVNFEHISHLVLVFLLLTLSR